MTSINKTVSGISSSPSSNISFIYLSASSLDSSDLTGTPFIRKQSCLTYYSSSSLLFCIWRFACFRLITCFWSKHLSASSLDILSICFSICSLIIFSKPSNTVEQMSFAMAEKELWWFSNFSSNIFLCLQFTAPFFLTLPI